MSAITLNLYPDDNKGNTKGGQSVPYGLSLSYGSADIPTDVKTLLVIFPQEFYIPISTLICTPKFGYTATTINCQVESINHISIETSGINIAETLSWMTISSIVNPIVESGPFTFTVLRVSQL
jgi:hypothetical protein